MVTALTRSVVAEKALRRSAVLLAVTVVVLTKIKAAVFNKHFVQNKGDRSSERIASSSSTSLIAKCDKEASSDEEARRQ